MQPLFGPAGGGDINAYNGARQYHSLMQEHMSSSLFFVTACLLVAFGGPTLAVDQVTSQEPQKKLPGQSADKTFTMTLEATKPKDYCRSSTSIEYQQRDDVAHLTGEINVDGCTNAAGEYTVSIRTRDDNGDTLNTDFEETWERSDDQPIAFAKDYRHRG